MRRRAKGQETSETVHHKSLNLKISMKKKGLEKKAAKEFAKIKHTQKRLKGSKAATKPKVITHQSDI